MEEGVGVYHTMYDHYKDPQKIVLQIISASILWPSLRRSGKHSIQVVALSELDVAKYIPRAPVT